MKRPAPALPLPLLIGLVVLGSWVLHPSDATASTNLELGLTSHTETSPMRIEAGVALAPGLQRALDILQGSDLASEELLLQVSSSGVW